MCSQEQADQWWADAAGADGVCDKGELSRVLAENFSQATIDNMFKKFDTDGSGTISKDEFYMAVLPKEKRSQAMKRFFGEMDKDGNGRLSSDEIVERCKSIRDKPDEVKALKEIMEAAGDDGMDAEEFADFMNRM